jgi:hypothetical protein
MFSRARKFITTPKLRCQRIKPFVTYAIIAFPQRNSDVRWRERFDELARIVKERHLEKLFRFVPYQERKVLRYSLGTLSQDRFAAGA